MPCGSGWRVSGSPCCSWNRAARGRTATSSPSTRDELLDRELFYTLAEAQILTERWRQEYNHLRPHSALSYRPPAPEVIAPLPLRLSSVALPDPLRMAVCGFIFSRLSAR